MELSNNLQPKLQELIIRDVMKYVDLFQININEDFPSFFVNLMLLNPQWHIGDTCDLVVQRRELEKFVKFCIYNLTIASNPAIETMKMQRYYNFHIEHLDEVVENTRCSLKERLERLEMQIIIDKDNEGDILHIYQKIVFYITLLSGLGNPAENGVYKEAITALHSIFDKKDLREFIKDNPFNKSNQLVELAELVTGIRLFNRDCNRGGQGIEDIFKLLNQLIDALNKEYQETLVNIMDCVNTLTTAIDVSFAYESNKNFSNLYCIVPAGVEYSDVEKIKDTLIAFRQYEITIRKFLAEIENIENNTRELQESLNAAFNVMHDIVRFHTAIPAVTVFPQFINISNIWCALQNNIIKLAKMKQIGDYIQLFETNIALNKKVTSTMLGTNEILTDAQRLEKTTGQRFVVNNPNINVLLPSEIKDFDKTPLQYLGFCAWKLIKSYGGLFPGNPNMGVMEINNKYYVFSTVEAAEAFAVDPEKCINKATILARQKPELIHLLQIYDQVYEKRHVEELVEESPRRVITRDVKVQTELHPIKTKIDKNYMWNVWDLRRQALLFANLSQCKTHSTQTYKSNFKNDVKIQTYGTKEQISQTKKDNYTNVPTLSNFIYGLRGRKDDKQFIIELTRPVDE